MPFEPLVLPANQPTDRFYRGGRRITDFRSIAPGPDHTPEDWVGSTTSVRGDAPVGQTRLPDGRLLVDAVSADPESWLGAAHLARFGVDTKLLVKLLDAGQRLPVHAHPDAAFAAQHLGVAHGKAEAWYLLTSGVVHVGLKADIAADDLARLSATQDTDTLLGLLHRIEVDAHDTVFVPPGTLHAIGEGTLLAEVQEPEDLSILLEWRGFDLDGAADGHLGLGFETALGAVDRTALTQDALSRLVRRHVADGPALATGADEFFRLDRVTSSTSFDAGFAVVIGLEAGANLTAGSWSSEIPPGTTILVPAAAGPLRFDGRGSALVARPPRARP